MPELKNTEHLEKLFLPSTQDAPEPDKAWVVMDIGEMTAGDMVNVRDMTTSLKMTTDMLVGRIREWNFTDAAGEPMPITAETVKLMDVADFFFLSKQFKDGVVPLDDDQKKT